MSPLDHLKRSLKKRVYRACVVPAEYADELKKLQVSYRMRFTASLVAAIAAGSSLVYAGLEDVKSGRHLTSTNFDSAIKGKNALVAFYAPW